MTILTDLGINKALALAIGYPPEYVWAVRAHGVLVYRRDGSKTRVYGLWQKGWRTFDYRDWNVIGPIAEKLIVELIKCETKGIGYWQAIHGMEDDIGHCVSNADTPQKAIALAVIGAKA